MNNVTVTEAIKRGLIHEGDVVEVKSAKTGKILEKTVDFIDTDKNTFEDADGHSWGRGEYLRTITKGNTVSNAIMNGEFSEGDFIEVRSAKTGKIVTCEVVSINENKNTFKDAKGTVWGASEFVGLVDSSDDDSDLNSDDDDNFEDLDNENDDENDNCAHASEYLKVGQTVEIESASSGKVYNRTVASVTPGRGFTCEKGYFWDTSTLLSHGLTPVSSLPATPTPTVGAADLRTRIQRSALPKEDRLLRENGLEDDNGAPTMEARDYVLQVLTEKQWGTLRTSVATILEKELKNEENDSL